MHMHAVCKWVQGEIYTVHFAHHAMWLECMSVQRKADQCAAGRIAALLPVLKLQLLVAHQPWCHLQAWVRLLLLLLLTRSTLTPTAALTSTTRCSATR
jgi:hypothetical protein